MRSLTLFHFVFLFFLLLQLGGCASLSDLVTFGEQEEVDQPEKSAVELIEEGMSGYREGKYHLASVQFEQLLEDFPFSPQAMLAKLKLADCHYYSERYGEAKLAYRDFSQHHPTNEAMPYVLFQMGLSDLRQVDRIDRDPALVRMGISTLRKLLRAYPGSAYEQSARQRIASGQAFLAHHELYVAVFYLRTRQPDAAAGRLRYLIDTYPEADVVPKAQELLTAIEAGHAPKLGVDRWLPDWLIPEFETAAPTSKG